MIAKITGIVESIEAMAATLLTNSGLGYELHLSQQTIDQIKVGKETTLFTYLEVKENAHKLWGFYSKEEKTMFLHLTSVNGVGCNTARLILSIMQPKEIASAIIKSDITAIKKIKGIGEKSAKKIVLDLAEKLTKLGYTTTESIGIGNAAPLSDNPIREDAIAALMALSFSKIDAQKKVNRALKDNPGLDVNGLIKESLKM